MFRVPRRAPGVLCLHHGSYRAESAFSVFTVFKCHEVEKDASEGHTRVHGVGDRCIAAARVPSQQTLAFQAHGFELVLPAGDFYLRLRSLIYLCSAKFVQYVLFALQIFSKSLTVAAAAHHSVTARSSASPGHTSNFPTLALEADICHGACRWSC